MPALVALLLSQLLVPAVGVAPRPVHGVAERVLLAGVRKRRRAKGRAEEEAMPDVAVSFEYSIGEAAEGDGPG